MNVSIPKIVVEQTVLILVGILYNLLDGSYRAVPSLVGWNFLALIIVLLVSKIMKSCGLLLRQNLWNGNEDFGGRGAMDPLIVLQFDWSWEAAREYELPEVNYLLIILLIMSSVLIGSAIGLYHARYWVEAGDAWE